MTLLFYFYFLSLIVGQSVMELSHILIFLTVLFLVFFKRKELPQDFFSISKEEKNLFYIMMALAIFSLASLIFSPDQDFLKFKNYKDFKWILEFITIYFFLKRIDINHKKISVCFNMFFFCSLYAFIIYLVGKYPFARVPQGGFEITNTDMNWRAGGLFQQSMPFAHSYGTIFMFFFAYMLPAKLETFSLPNFLKKESLKNTLYLVISFLAVLVSFTRGVWIGLLGSFVIFVLLTNYRRYLIHCFVFLTICGGLLMTIPKVQDRVSKSFTGGYSGDNDRLVLWKTNFTMFLDHPITGIGYNENRKYLREYYDKLGFPSDQFEGHAHNSYIQWLSTTGILGLGSYLLLIGYFLWLTFKYLRLTQNEFYKKILTGLLCSQIVFHIGALTEANFFISKNRFMIMFIFALTVYFVRQSKKELTQTSPQTA